MAHCTWGHFWVFVLTNLPLFSVFYRRWMYDPVWMAMLLIKIFLLKYTAAKKATTTTTRLLFRSAWGECNIKVMLIRLTKNKAHFYFYFSVVGCSAHMNAEMFLYVCLFVCFQSLFIYFFFWWNTDSLKLLSWLVFFVETKT